MPMPLLDHVELIMRLRREGKSMAYILRELKKKDSHAKRFKLKYFISRWHLSPLSERRRYRPRALAPYIEKIWNEIRSSYAANSSIAIPAVKSRLRDLHNITVGETQLRYFRRLLGFSSTGVQYCQMIKEENKHKRLEFATSMLAQNETFADGIFTDESTVEGFSKLVHDNAPAHKSAFTKKKLDAWKIKVLDWPPESPDLNPIELIWGSMKGFLRRQSIRTLRDLTLAIQEFWGKLMPQKCKRYVEGVQWRLQEVVKAGGGNIREKKPTSPSGISRSSLPSTSHADPFSPDTSRSPSTSLLDLSSPDTFLDLSF